ncbi:competence protein CoiA family protein [Hydrogenovibrio thermophilus]|nr:competence protein CoiA family protein [Hydrogenovibrio thermophilus]
MSKSLKIGFAEDCKGQLISIHEASKGLEYYCPVCKSSLIIKQGVKRCKHFAHKTKEESSHESVLHYVAKHCLKNLLIEGYIPISPYQIIRKAPSEFYEKNFYASLVEPKFNNFKLSEVCVEKSVNEIALISDVLAVESFSDKYIAFEVAVTNFKSEDHINEYKDKDISCLEFDLSSMNYDVTVEEIKLALKDKKRIFFKHLSNQLLFIMQANQNLSEQIENDRVDALKKQHKHMEGLNLTAEKSRGAAIRERKYKEIDRALWDEDEKEWIEKKQKEHRKRRYQNILKNGLF